MQLSCMQHTCSTKIESTPGGGKGAYNSGTRKPFVRRCCLQLKSGRTSGGLRCSQQPQQSAGDIAQQSAGDIAEGETPELSSSRKHEQRMKHVLEFYPLLLVSLLWGSYTPALRYLYSTEPLLTPAVLTAHRTVYSAVALLAASAASIGYNYYTNTQQQHQPEPEPMLQEQQQHPGQPQHNQTAPDSLSGSSISSNAKQQEGRALGGNESSGATRSAAAVLAAGLELGIWNFLGTSSQAIGVELSTATKAAFLTQTTAVFTPCLAVLCGQTVLPVHWAACLVALLGSCCITLDSMQPQLPVLSVNEEVAVTALHTTATAGVSSSTTSTLAAPTIVTAAPQQDAGMGSRSATAVALLWQQQQQVVKEAAKNAAVTASNSGDSGVFVATDSGNDSTTSGNAVAVPAVRCGPTSTPPQGIVHAIACAPVQFVSSSSSILQSSAISSNGGAGSSKVADAGSTPPVAAAQAGNTSSSMTSSSQAASPRQQAEQQALQQAEARSSGQQRQEHGVLSSDTAVQHSSDSGSSSSWSGEVYILVACACYAIATVRLSTLAPGLDPVQLATSKTLTLAAASMCWLLAFQDGSVTTAGSIQAVAAENVPFKEAVATALQSASVKWQLPETIGSGTGMLLLVYSALGPGALATVMQAKGQAVASAAEAQVFYSLTPVMSALLAAIFLQGERMGLLAWFGGLVIVAASIGTALAGESKTNSSVSTSRNGSGADVGSSASVMHAESASDAITSGNQAGES